MMRADRYTLATRHRLITMCDGWRSSETVLFGHVPFVCFHGNAAISAQVLSKNKNGTVPALVATIRAPD